MSILQLNNKLYNFNFKSEHIRLNTYLSLHASLLRNKEVPRTYLLHDSHLSTTQNISDLFYSDCNKIVEVTNDFLKSLSISTSFINSLTFDEKSEILQILESLLEIGWGEGKVIYENMRLTPFCTCDFLDYLKNTDYNDETAVLLKLLNNRSAQSNKLKADLEIVFSSGSRKYHPSVLSKSYQMLLEKNWRNSWMHQSNYVSKNNIDNLLLVKDII